MRSRSSRSPFALKALLAALFPFLFLGLVELGLRLALRPPPARKAEGNFQYAYVDILSPFFRPERTVFGRERVYHSARPHARPVRFSMPKPPGTFRVFVVGGSVAVAYSDPEKSLLKMLSAAYPGRRFEVLGCGMGAYDSQRDLLTLREVLDYEPDAVLVLSGNNEYFGSLPSRPRLHAAAWALGRLWIVRGLFWKILNREEEASRRDSAPEQCLPRLRENLLAMARLARARRVPLVFCTLPANLKDSVPHRAAEHAGDPDFQEGKTAVEEDDARAARPSLERFLDRFPEDPWGHYLLARSLDALGEKKAAREHYGRAADLDLPGERCSPERNALIRRIAAQVGALLADAEMEFARHAPFGIPGSESFQDACHWYHALYPLLDWAALRALNGAGVLPSPDARPASAARALYAQALGSPGQPNFEQYAHVGMLDALYHEQDRPNESAVSLFMRAAGMSPRAFVELLHDPRRYAELVDHPLVRDDKEFLLSQGAAVRRRILAHGAQALFRLRRYREALELFLEAENLGARMLFVRLGEAAACARLGRVREARARFDALSEAFPDEPLLRIWRRRCRVPLEPLSREASAQRAR